MKTLRVGPACYHTLHLLPAMVAHEMNFFYEEGLHDEDGRRSYEIVLGGLAPFGFEKEVLPRAMFDRGMDIAMDVLPATALLAQQQGRALYVIAGWRNQQPGWLAARPDIKEVAQLKGKRIAVRDYKSIQWRALCGALVRAGLDPNRDVTFQDRVMYGEVPQAVVSGTVDAGLTSDLEAARTHGLSVLDSIASHYPNGRPDRVIAATGEVLDQHPELVKAYLRATIRAYWFIRRQPDNAAYLSALEHRLAIDSPNEEERQLRHNHATSAERFAQMPFPIDGLPTGFDQYFQEQVDIGDLEEVGAYEQILRLDPVREAFRELAMRGEFQSEIERAREVANRLGY